MKVVTTQETLLQHLVEKPRVGLRPEKTSVQSRSPVSARSHRLLLRVHHHYDIHASVNAFYVKHIYASGLENHGISKEDVVPEARVDHGSSDKSFVTQECFSLVGAGLGPCTNPL
jgi:hypothetical protein